MKNENATPPLGRIAVPLARTVLSLVSRFKLIGMENWPEPPFVVVANHLSSFDAVAAAATQPFNIPVLTARKHKARLAGFLLDLFATPIYIEQNSPDRSALKAALALLKSGRPLAVAPEGTRSKSGALQKGLEGAAFLIRRAGVPVVPVAVWGTERILKTLRPIVVTHIGRPYWLPESVKRGKESLAEDTERLMCSIAAMLPEKYHGVYAGNPLIKEMAAVVC